MLFQVLAVSSRGADLHRRLQKASFYILCRANWYTRPTSKMVLNSKGWGWLPTVEDTQPELDTDRIQEDFSRRFCEAHLQNGEDAFDQYVHQVDEDYEVSDRQFLYKVTLGKSVFTFNNPFREQKR